MANVYSTQYAKINAGSKLDFNELGGDVRLMHARYVQGAAAGAIGDIVYFGKLPKGARLLPGGKMYWGTGAASSTIKIGITGNDDGMVAATAVTTAGSVALDGGDHFTGGADTVLSSEVDVIGTVAGAGLAAAQAITVYLPYVLN